MFFSTSKQIHGINFGQRLEKGIIGKDFKKIIARSRGENN